MVSFLPIDKNNARVNSLQRILTVVDLLLAHGPNQTKRVVGSSLHGAILALGGTLSRRQLVTARLHALAVDARGALVGATLLLTAVVGVNDVKGVNVAGDVSEEGEGDVDEDVGAAAGGKEDAYRRDCVREEEVLAWRA